METATLRMQPNISQAPLFPLPKWGAIWGGSLAFVAIWTVFESLAWALWRSNPTTGMELGVAVWTVILTAIAMYFGGIVTGRLAGLTTRGDAIAHGLMMFGLSVAGMMVLSTMAGVLLSIVGTATNNSNAWAVAFTRGSAWTEFFSLLLGWLAAMWGAARGVIRGSIEMKPVVTERTAA